MADHEPPRRWPAEGKIDVPLGRDEHVWGLTPGEARTLGNGDHARDGYQNEPPKH
jgi:hypothetical protein